jgi:hypothetical protein
VLVYLLHTVDTKKTSTPKGASFPALQTMREALLSSLQVYPRIGFEKQVDAPYE